MKRIFHSLFFLLFQLSFALAQNYQCIQEGREFYYIEKNGYNIKAVRIDSVKTIGSFDYYYNYPTFRSSDYIYECYIADAASWIGKYVVTDPNGYYYFFNLEGDTVKIYTGAGVNDSWDCYKFENGNYIEASVFSINTMAFIGVVDSVKTIHFQARNSIGEPVSHLVNNLSLKLSKEHGLIQLVNFIAFPDLSISSPFYPYYEQTELFIICGMTNPDAGRTNLTLKEVYDFEIEDEFHTLYTSAYGGLEQRYDTIWTILKVLDKVSYSEGDSIAYTYQRIWKHNHYTSDTAYTNILNDTITELISFVTQSGMNFNSLPDEPVFVDYWAYNMYMSESAQSHDRTMKTIPNQEAWLISFDSCWCSPILDGCFPDNSYIDGCGGPYYQCTFFWDEFENKLVYYDKGYETWGTPFDPGILLKDNTITFENEFLVNIYPNPLKEQATIRIENGNDFPYRIEIFNIIGTRLVNKSIISSQTCLSEPLLEPGIYTYRITGHHYSVVSGKLVIQ